MRVKIQKKNPYLNFSGVYIMNKNNNRRSQRGRKLHNESGFLKIEREKNKETEIERESEGERKKKESER